MSTQIRLEGLSLTVKNVKKSVDFYTKKIGFECPYKAIPDFVSPPVEKCDGGRSKSVTPPAFHSL